MSELTRVDKLDGVDEEVFTAWRKHQLVYKKCKTKKGVFLISSIK